MLYNWKAIIKIERIKFIHNSQYVHRDLKPDNFVIGLRNLTSLIYILDFGLAKKYIDSKLKHIVLTKKNKLIGTTRYASVNAHLGIEISRRDDLESLGYLIIYMLRGILPWEMKGKNDKCKLEQVAKMKGAIALDNLCSGCPKEAYSYMKYCKDLKFDEEPNYGYLQSQFENILKEKMQEKDGVFDWHLVLVLN